MSSDDTYPIVRSWTVSGADRRLVGRGHVPLHPMTCSNQQIKKRETKVHLLVAWLNLAIPQLPALIMGVNSPPPPKSPERS